MAIDNDMRALMDRIEQSGQSGQSNPIPNPESDALKKVYLLGKRPDGAMYRISLTPEQEALIDKLLIDKLGMRIK
jgi:hypothetical protein